MYSNDTIKKLIARRDQKILEMNCEIEKEIQKEKAKHRFSWSRFLLMVFIFLLPFMSKKMCEWNAKIFPPNSIWSWNYYKINI